MNAPPLNEQLLNKLAASSLFRTYHHAFELATGCHLDLVGTWQEMESDKLVVPVPLGRVSPLQLVARLGRKGEEGGEEFVRSVHGLLEAFARQLGEESNRAMLESNKVEPSGVQRAKQFLHQHLREKIHLDDVAEAVGVCSFQLCRLFKEHTGMTMTEYVSRKRVEHAKNGLRDFSRQIIEIAEGVGFSSLSQFNRNFLKYAGESPTEYRSRLKELEHCDLMAV